MRPILASLAVVPFLLAGCTNNAEPAPTAPVETAAPAPKDPPVNLVKLTDRTLEVGCGMCVYHLDSVKTCRAAAVVDGSPVIVMGGGAEGHAHEFCDGTKTAVISGTVIDGVLQATRFDVVE